MLIFLSHNKATFQHKLPQLTFLNPHAAQIQNSRSTPATMKCQVFQRVIQSIAIILKSFCEKI